MDRTEFVLCCQNGIRREGDGEERRHGFWFVSKQSPGDRNGESFCGAACPVPL